MVPSFVAYSSNSYFNLLASVFIGFVV